MEKAEQHHQPIMSTEKTLARPPPETNGGDEEQAKRRRYDRWFSGLEFKIDAGPLKDLDSEKIKSEIKRWAKAVVAYARQLSGSLGSGRRSESWRSRSDVSSRGRMADD